MKKTKIIAAILLITATVIFFTTGNIAQDSPKFQYIGSKKCKMCHSADKKGGQFKSWEASKHAQAHAVLASPEAKKIAAEKGIADPQKDGKCLKCHVTAYGVDAKFLGEKYSMEEGIGCESCHGAGEKYMDKKTMEELSLGKADAASVGLVIPGEKLCIT